MFCVFSPRITRNVTFVYIFFLLCIVLCKAEIAINHLENRYLLFVQCLNFFEKTTSLKDKGVTVFQNCLLLVIILSWTLLEYPVLGFLSNATGQFLCLVNLLSFWLILFSEIYYKDLLYVVS